MKHRNISGHILVGVTFALGAMFAVAIFAAALEVLLGWPAMVTAGILAIGGIFGAGVALNDDPDPGHVTPLDVEVDFDASFHDAPATPWPTYDPFTEGEGTE